MPAELAVGKERSMKKTSAKTTDADMPDEFPAGFFKRGMCGKYHSEYAGSGKTIVMVCLEPDVAKEFRSSGEVNEALRLLQQLRNVGKPKKVRKTA